MIAPPPERILLVCLNQLGDCILFFPVAVALRRACPTARLALLTTRIGAEAAALTGVFDTCLVPKTSRTDRKVRHRFGLLGMLGAVRRAGYDLALMASGESSYVAALLRAAGIPRRVGFDDCKLRRLLTHRVTAFARENESRRNARLLGALGLEESVERPPCAIPESAVQEAEERLAAIIPPEDAALPRVLIHPGAALVNRRWPPAQFAELTSRLISARLALPILLEGPAEAGLGREICGLSGRRLPLLADVSLAALAAMMRRVNLFVGHSTGPFHLAVWAGAPTVSLWGVSDPVVWGPAWTPELHTLIRSPIPCAAGDETRCGVLPCMEAISTNEVFAAIARRLQGG